MEGDSVLAVQKRKPVHLSAARRQTEREKQGSPTSNSVMNNSNMPDLMEEITFSQSLKLSNNAANAPR